MDPALQHTVRRRAVGRCEYCRIHEDDDLIAFQIDHVFAVSHGGPTRANNLALACYFCNLFKGPNLSGIDPQAGRLVPLFHPRRQRWGRHFRWAGPRTVGRTESGRATVAALNMNNDARVALRATLIAAGRFPPA